MFYLHSSVDTKCVTYHSTLTKPQTELCNSAIKQMDKIYYQQNLHTQYHANCTVLINYSVHPLTSSQPLISCSW